MNRVSGQTRRMEIEGWPLTTSLVINHDYSSSDAVPSLIHDSGRALDLFVSADSGGRWLSDWCIHAGTISSLPTQVILSLRNYLLFRPEEPAV